MIQLIDPKRQAELEDTVVRISVQLQEYKAENALLRNQMIRLERNFRRLEDRFQGLSASGGVTRVSGTISEDPWESFFGRDSVSRESTGGIVISSSPFSWNFPDDV